MVRDNRKSIDVKRLVYIAVFTAIVVVLQFIPIKIGTFELALSVPIIVIGAALCGATVGAWLGFVFGFIVLLLPGTSAFLSFNLFGTIVTVLLKGILAGLLAGLAYRAVARFNKYVGCLVSAITATVVNTSVFLIGSLIFFESDISIIVNTFISINFVIELIVNIVLVPTVYRIINIKQKI